MIIVPSVVYYSSRRGTEVSVIYYYTTAPHDTPFQHDHIDPHISMDISTDISTNIFTHCVREASKRRFSARILLWFLSLPPPPPPFILAFCRRLSRPRPRSATCPTIDYSTLLNTQKRLLHACRLCSSPWFYIPCIHYGVVSRGARRLADHPPKCRSRKVLRSASCATSAAGGEWRRCRS